MCNVRLRYLPLLLSPFHRCGNPGTEEVSGRFLPLTPIPGLTFEYRLWDPRAHSQLAQEELEGALGCIQPK